VTGPSGAYGEMGRTGLIFAAGEMDASAECKHGRLPSDKSKPCGCWNEAQVIDLTPRKACWYCGGSGVKCCEYGAAA
jgi:hypothetical protein